MRKPIVVVGSINLDLVATADHVPLPGETIIGKDFRIFHGGKGANQAVGVARLNHPVSMLGNVGDDDFGSALKAALRQAGVAANSVRTVRGSSGVALINIGSDGQNNIVVVPGANGQLSPKDITAHSALLRKAGMILVQLEIPLITLETVAAFAHRHKIPLMLDPAPARELPSGLLQVVTWITPNESETRILCALPPSEPVTPETAARTNTDWSPSGTIFSSGGSVLCTLGRSARIPLTISSVEAFPFLKIEISTPRRPFCRTIFDCTWNPSLTLATSRR